MKISRSLVAAALSGALVLGGTTAAIAQLPEAADTINIPLPATIEVDGVTYFKKTKTNDKGVEEEYYENADGGELTVLEVKAIVDRSNASEDEEESESSSSEEATATASESEKTSEPTETTSEKTTEPKESESASETKSSESSASATSTESSDSSASATTTESTDASATTTTTTPSSSKSAEPTPTNEPGDKKSSARDALSSKDGKPTPLAIFGIVAGVLAAVAAAFPVIAKTLNLNIKLPF